MSENSIRLTQYSHGAGCGCKISPKVLETILHSEQAKFVDPNLLVGNETRDDAAVYDLGIDSILSTAPDALLLSQAMERAAELLEDTAERLMRIILALDRTHSSV